MQRLRSVAAPTDVIVSSTTRLALSRSLLDGQFDLAVLDPAFDGNMRPNDRAHFTIVETLQELRAPIATAVIYGRLTESSMRSAISLARHYPVDVVWRGQSDEDSQLRLCLYRSRTHTSARLAMLLDRYLAGPTGRFAGPSHGERLRRAIAAVMLNPRQMKQVADIATVVGYRERTLERQVGDAGLTGVQHLLVAARTALAHQRLTSSSVRVAQLAGQLGYKAARGLREATLRCAGLTPTQLRNISTQQLADRLFAWLTNHPGSARESAEQRVSVGSHTDQTSA
jgi:AraC-like DNA-binding protein